MTLKTPPHILTEINWDKFPLAMTTGDVHEEMTRIIELDREHIATALLTALEGGKRDLAQIEQDCIAKGVGAGKRKRAISVAFGNNKALDQAKAIVTNLLTPTV